MSEESQATAANDIKLMVGTINRETSENGDFNVLEYAVWNWADNECSCYECLLAFIVEGMEKDMEVRA